MRIRLVHMLFGLGACEPDVWSECCGDQTELRTCETAKCPTDKCRDCVWADWGDYGPCGCFGLQDRFRDIKIESNACGKPCTGPKVDTKQCLPRCIKEEKPRDCELTPWTPWSRCSKTCDVGQQFRERSLKNHLLNGGLPCNDTLKETRVCADHGCEGPQDCVFDDWTPWTECTQSCSGGQQQRTRTIKTPAKDYGKLCNDTLVQLRGCNQQACTGVLNCQWGDWISWSTCSATCNGGQKSRSRLITVAPRHGGRMCDPNDMSEIAPCATQPCAVPVDCVIGEWTAWSACTCDCNGATSRTRHVETYPAHGGKGCEGSLKEITYCNTGPEHCKEIKVEVKPPVDCLLTPWLSWSGCTKHCGGGIQERSREIRVEPEFNGKPCDDSLSEIQGCNEKPCATEPLGHAIDCIWGDWSEWNVCTESCGGGIHQRSRDIKQCANQFGKPCESFDAVEIEGCNNEPCSSTDCVWGPWGEWGACSCTALRERARNVAQHSFRGGAVCTGPKVITESCKSECMEPPFDCKLSEWVPWSRCSAPCGGGETFRTRHIEVNEARGGIPCDGNLKELAPCDTNSCTHPVDCHLAEWSHWSNCSASCGGGQMTRERDILTFGAYGGKACTDELKEIKGCNTDACGDAQDCKWGLWKEWSACTKTCGGGQRNRERSVEIAPRRWGKLCDPLTKAEIEPCNEHSCEGDCIDAQWAEWEDWGLCSASCGRGYMSRWRAIKQKPNYCGKGIEGNMTEYQQCNEAPCGSDAVDCKFGPWSPFGSCSCSCDGTHSRSRHIAEYARNGGTPCSGGLKEAGGCNEGKCDNRNPVDCEFGEWKPWGKCSAECGGGIQSRIRYVLTEPSDNGKPCDGSLKAVQGCNFRPCTRATDCAWGEWADWDSCSADCGTGQRSRYRHIRILPSHDGKPCSAQDNVEVEACNTQACGKMMYCSWGSWQAWSACSKECGQGESTRKRELVTSAQPPDNGVLDSGVLSHLEAALAFDTKPQFSLEEGISVFVFSVILTSFGIATGMAMLRRFSQHHPRETAE